MDYVWSCFSEKLYSSIPEDGSKIHLPIRLNFPNEEDCFQLLTNSGHIDIQFIELDAILWIETEKIYPTFMRAYKDYSEETDNLAEIQEFEFDTPNKKVIMDFFGSDVSGKQGVVLRTKEKKN